MALGPISTSGVPPQPSPARDVSGAQRAFFQAALTGVAPVAVVDPPAAQPAPARESPRAAESAEAPKAAYRPGSLLDIRI